MIINVKSFEEPQINKKEILRYAGAKADDETLSDLMNECLNELLGTLKYTVCWCELPISGTDNETDLSFMKTKSKALKINLSGCHKIILFAATVGIEIDRKIERYGKISPVKSLLFQAIGAERIEALCDKFNDEIKNDLLNANLYTRPRFSPGYGDFELDAQTEIFKILDCQRKIGLTLNQSLLMSPSKSVTAIIGISDKNKDCNEHKCDDCNKTDCSFGDR